MARLQMPLGFLGTENLPKTNRSLENCFNNGNGIVINIPGISSFISATANSVARGAFVWNDDLYAVFSDVLIKINVIAKTFETIGTIAGTDNIRVAIGFNDAVIVVDAVAGKIYALSNSTTFINISGVTNSGGVASFTHAGTTPAIGNTVTIKGFVTNTAYNVTGEVTASTATTFEISSISFGTDEATGSFTLVLSAIDGNANFVPCAAVSHVNGKFNYVPFSGDPFFFSDVGAAGTVQAASFVDAEELPDKNNTTFNFRNVLYIGGTDSFELFRDSGATPVPWVRVAGARIDTGFIGGLLEYNQTFLFVGREKNQDFGIYAIGQGAAPKISNERIDLLLSTKTPTQLAATVANRIKWRGYDIAAFTVGNESFGFYGGQWFLLSTSTDGEKGAWAADHIAQFEGKYYSFNDDKIGIFERVNTDFGNPKSRSIQTVIEKDGNQWFAVKKIELGISQGFKPGAVDVETVALQISRDNLTFGDEVFRKLGGLGEYQKRLIWKNAGGIGKFEGFMAMRFKSSENVDFSTQFIDVELG